MYPVYLCAHHPALLYTSVYCLVKGLPEMTVEYVDMVALDGGLTDSVASKLSSTELRKQLLGEYRTPKVNRTICSSGSDGEGPFVIGLTGGIASGKTSICKRLAQLGAGVIDCDKVSLSGGSGGGSVL